MPFKKLKTYTADALTLEWVLHVRHYQLSLGRNQCVSCELCSLACPKEAITLEKIGEMGEKPRTAVDIDLEKCNFCGVCDAICPFGAIRTTMNGQHAVPAVEKECFPKLIRDIQVDSSKYYKQEQSLEQICPLNLITLVRANDEDKMTENLALHSRGRCLEGKIHVQVDKERCPCCRLCEINGPPGAFKVKKFLHGSIVIDQSKCPRECRACVDVCPVTGALHLGTANAVSADETFCVYCGACKIVCPVNNAISLKRTGIDHTPVRSGTWNKALERITSTIEIAKELDSKRSKKTVDNVAKLFTSEKDAND